EADVFGPLVHAQFLGPTPIAEGVLCAGRQCRCPRNRSKNRSLGDTETDCLLRSGLNRRFILFPLPTLFLYPFGGHSPNSKDTCLQTRIAWMALGCSHTAPTNSPDFPDASDAIAARHLALPCLLVNLHFFKAMNGCQTQLSRTRFQEQPVAGRLRDQ